MGKLLGSVRLQEVKGFTCPEPKDKMSGKRAECARTEGDARGKEKCVPLGQKVLPDFKKHLLSSTIGKTE